MTAFEIIGGISSMLGFLVSIATLSLVIKIKHAVKRHSRHRQLTEIIDRILAIPENKLKLPNSTCREIQFIIDTARRYDFSPWFFLDRNAKQLVHEIEVELAGQRRRAELQNYLRLLRDEITVR